MLFLRFSWLLDLNFSLIKLVDKYKKNIHWKKGWLIYKWRRNLTFQQLKKTSFRSFSHKKNFKRQNERVDIVWRIFEKISKKLKLKSKDPKKHSFWKFQLNLPKTTFSGPVTSFWTFFHYFQICARVYRPFRSFCLLWKFVLLERFWSNFT